MATTPSATPTPMPAFAPELRPGELGSVGAVVDVGEVMDECDVEVEAGAADAEVVDDWLEVGVGVGIVRFSAA